MPTGAPEAPNNPSTLPIEAWLVQWLKTGAPLIEVVGGRVHFQLLPAKAALPGVVVKRAGTRRSYTTRGQADGTTAMFRVECQAKSDDAGGLANGRAALAIRDLVNGLQADVADGKGGFYFLERVAIADEFDEEDGSLFADEAEYFTRVILLEVAYLETVREKIGGA